MRIKITPNTAPTTIPAIAPGASPLDVDCEDATADSIGAVAEDEAEEVGTAGRGLLSPTSGSDEFA